jgi:uncharacterized protein YggU (UPF0235/DUF167 family)
MKIKYQGSSLLLPMLMSSVFLTACGSDSATDTEEQPSANSAPSASNLILNDENGGDVVVGDGLVASYTYADTESDEEGETLIQWLRDEIQIQGASGINYQVTEDDLGTSISFTVTPLANTGTLQGSVQTSTALNVPELVVTNSAPSAQAVTLFDLNDGSAQLGDVLEIQYSYFDADGDLEDTSEQGTVIQWFRDGESIADANLNQYTVLSIDQGLEVSVEVTPKALTGELAGVTTSRAINVLGNSAPVVQNVRIDHDGGQDIPVSGDELTGLYVYSDSEGDEEGTTSFKWLRDGVEIEGQTSNVYLLRNEDSGKTLSFQVTPKATAGLLEGVAVTANIDVALPSPNLAFQQTGTFKILVDEYLANPADSDSSAGVVYSTANTRVALTYSGVNAEGKVYGRSAGTTQVIAEVEATDTHTADSAFYDVQVQRNQFNFKGWMGENDTIISFEDDLTGISMSRMGCSIYAPSRCGEYDQVELGDRTTLTDEAATLVQSGFYEFTYGDHVTQAQASPKRFAYNIGSAYVSFKGKLWHIGGSRNQSGSNEIWSSVDGNSWQQEVTSEEIFPARSDHQVIEFNGKLWLTGGKTQDNGWSYYADVWSSEDGIHWIEETNSAEFGARSSHQMTLANGKLWLAGFHDTSQSASKSKLWSSADGVTWIDEGTLPGVFYLNNIELGTLVGQEGALDKIFLQDASNNYMRNEDGSWGEAKVVNMTIGSQMIAHDNALWIVSPQSQKVAYTYNGNDWFEINDVQLPVVSDSGLASFKNKMWVMTGNSADYSSGTRAFSSEDGNNWKNYSDIAEFTLRFSPGFLTFDEELHVIGGNYYGATLTDVWSSGDGIDWEQKVATYDPDTGSYSTLANTTTSHVVEFDGQLWASSHNDLYKSDDGKDWRKVTTTGYPNISYGLSKLIVYPDVGLVLLTHNHSTNGFFNYSQFFSADGINWTGLGDSVSQGNQFKNEIGFDAVWFNDKAWVIGGYANGATSNEVWSSDLAGQWQQEVSAQESFPGRQYPAAVVWNDKIWLTGGRDAAGGVLDDVWSSENGKDWTLVTDDAAFPGVFGHSMAVYEDKLYLIGGSENNDNKISDVWSTEDGIEWRKAFSGQVDFTIENKVIIR